MKLLTCRFLKTFYIKECGELSKQKHFLQVFQAVRSWEVDSSGSREERPVRSDKLKQGWKEYEQTFVEYWQKWLAEDFTAQEIAQAIVADAAKLRHDHPSIWCSSVKAKMPELLGRIFLLYTILRSGPSYKRCQEAANKAGETDSICAALDGGQDQDFFAKAGAALIVFFFPFPPCKFVCHGLMHRDGICQCPRWAADNFNMSAGFEFLQNSPGSWVLQGVVVLGSAGCWLFGGGMRALLGVWLATSTSCEMHAEKLVK